MARTMNIALIVGLALSLTSCMVGAVSVRHPVTMEEATCGPYFLKFGIGHDQQKSCLADYYRQGYVRVRN
jgi:hypothetical protein